MKRLNCSTSISFLYSPKVIFKYVPNFDGLNPSANSLTTIHLTEPNELRAIANLNPYKATGIDLITPRVLNPVLAPFHYTFAPPVHHRFKHQQHTI